MSFSALKAARNQRDARSRVSSGTVSTKMSPSLAAIPLPMTEKSPTSSLENPPEYTPNFAVVKEEASIFFNVKEQERRQKDEIQGVKEAWMQVDNEIAFNDVSTTEDASSASREGEARATLSTPPGSSLVTDTMASPSSPPMTLTADLMASTSLLLASPHSHPDLGPGNSTSMANLYKDLPMGLETRTTEKSGRGIYAKVGYRPGDVIISTRPFAAALSNSKLSTYCSACFGPRAATNLKRCMGCKTVYYCSAACQNRDWAIHKLECQSLQQWAQAAPNLDVSIPSDAVRCLGRLIWRRKKKGFDSTWSRQVEAMQSHRTDLQPDSFEMHTFLAHALIKYLGVDTPEELPRFGITSIAGVLDLISQFITNTFTITTPSLTPLGSSVSPLVALINHSCDPNAVVVFPRSQGPNGDEPRMKVVAIKPILPGQEVLASYIDTTLPRSQRRKELKETYHFTCQCPLCDLNTAMKDVDPRDAMQCPKRCGGRCIIPAEENDITRCTSCRAAVTKADEILDAMRIGEEALQKATSLQFKDTAKAKLLTTKLLPILSSAGLLPPSHPFLALSRLHQSLLISSLPDPLTQDALDDAIRAMTRSFAGMSEVLGYGHPVRGIALAELGKMLAVDEPSPKHAADESVSASTAPPSPFSSAPNMNSKMQVMATYPPSGPQRLRLALETLIKARDELVIGFGADGGQVGKEVREVIVGIEKELDVWKSGIRNAMEDIPRGTNKR